MKRAWRTAAAAALTTTVTLVMTWATPASADVVGPPPDDCPDGTTGRSCHGGTYCAPDVCTSDADCAAGEECTIVQACIGDIVCNRRLPPDANPEDHQLDTVEGLCPDGTACESGNCQFVSLCIPPAAPKGGSAGGDDEGGCGCHATAPRTGAGAGWLLLASALLLGRRRLSRR